MSLTTKSIYHKTEPGDLFFGEQFWLGANGQTGRTNKFRFILNQEGCTLWIGQLGVFVTSKFSFNARWWTQINKETED